MVRERREKKRKREKKIEALWQLLLSCSIPISQEHSQGVSQWFAAMGTTTGSRIADKKSVCKRTKLLSPGIWEQKCDES